MGKLNDITFQKTNGGLGRNAGSDDVISGLLMCLPELVNTDLIAAANTRQFEEVDVAEPGGSTSHKLYMAKLRYKEELADFGFQYKNLSLSKTEYTDASEATEFKKDAAVNTLVYHVTKFFDMNENGVLYLCVKVVDAGHVRGEDLKALQVFANGEIRQCGVFTPSLTAGAGNNIVDLLEEYQTALASNPDTDPDCLEAVHTPMSCVVAAGNMVTVTLPSGADNLLLGAPSSSSDLTKTKLASSNSGDKFAVAGRCNVSLLVGCDLDATLVKNLGQYAYYGCIGACLGALSKASVHESIAWVGKFPLGLKAPGLISGELIKEVSTADKEKIHGNRYLFVITHAGDADNYFNDSHTLDVDSSDYAYIENVRTIDKACRGIRGKLLPWLNSPLRVDPSNGQLESGMVSFLETTAGEALEEMEKVGEISGYKVEIDPAQNVLATSALEIVIKKVPVGVMRKVTVKIGYTTSLS